MKKGKLIVISGPSGVGKGTIVKALLSECDWMRLSVSATTRAIRPSEIDGVHYHFISQETFDQMLEQNAFLEHARYVNHSYGTPEAPVDEMLAQGLDVLLDIEVQGALQVQKRRPDAILIFLAAPSFDELARRLRGRGDTDEDVVRKRLETAVVEYTVAPKYDYIVVNDRVEEAVAEIRAILVAESLKAKNQEQILKEAMEHAVSPHE